MYTELLTLCGFEPAEIEKERPRIDKAFQKMGIGEEDIRRGESRIEEYFDVELEGVRKLLGVWMKELVSIALAREENRKVIMSEWPGPHTGFLAKAVYAVEDVYFGTPGMVFTIVLGGIFDKLNPLFEAGEGLGQAPGSAHCGLFQMQVGAIEKGLMPVPDLIVAPGCVCDAGAEAGELIHELYGIPVVYIDACLDWQWGEYPQVGTRQVKYISGKLAKVRRRIEDVIGYEIPEEGLTRGLASVGQTARLIQILAKLMAKADPQPISQANLDLLYFMLATPLRHRDEANEAPLADEVTQLIQQGKGVVPRGAPRVYSAMRFASNPDIWKMIQDVGLAVPVALLDWLPPEVRQRSQFADPIEALVDSAYRTTPACTASGNIWYDVECCKACNVDGAIAVYPFSCRAYANNPLMVAKAIKEELGIPAITLEYGGYDCRDYPAGALRTRVETFAELLRMRKASKVG